MSRLGHHLAPTAQASGHLLDEMGGSSDLRLLAVGDLEPRPGKRRFDLSAGHTLRLHDAISLIVGRLGRYGKPEVRKGEADVRMAGIQRPRGGAKYGASFGSALAMAISYNTNHSILWAIIHGIFSWIYVVYFALFYA